MSVKITENTQEKASSYILEDIDTLRASRNYYKDQCESLLLSLTQAAHKYQPAYRTQEEIDEMINSINLHNSEKRKQLKEQFNTERQLLTNEIEKMAATIANQETLIEKNIEEKASLIEQIMDYKAKLNDYTSKLSQYEQSGNMIINETEIYQSLKKENERCNIEIATLRKKVDKLILRENDARNSLSLAQTIQESLFSENQELKQENSNQSDEIIILKEKLNREIDIRKNTEKGLNQIKHEFYLFQNDVLQSNDRIEHMSLQLIDKHNEYQFILDEYKQLVSDAEKNREVFRDTLAKNSQFQAKFDDFQNRMDNMQKKFEYEIENYRTRIQFLTESLNEEKELNTQLNAKIIELNSNIKENEIKILQSQRNIKASEVAKETTLNNLRNAYKVINEKDEVNLEFRKEIDTITSENFRLTNENKEYEESIREKQNELDQLKEILVSKDDEIKRNFDVIMELNDKIKDIYSSTVSVEKYQSERSLLEKRISELQLKREAEDFDELKNMSELIQYKELFNSQQDRLTSLQKEIDHLNNTNKKLRSMMELSKSKGDCERCKKFEELIKKSTQEFRYLFDALNDSILHSRNQESLEKLKNVKTRLRTRLSLNEQIYYVRDIMKVYLSFIRELLSKSRNQQLTIGPNPLTQDKIVEDNRSLKDQLTQSLSKIQTQEETINSLNDKISRDQDEIRCLHNVLGVLKETIRNSRKRQQENSQSKESIQRTYYSISNNKTMENTALTQDPISILSLLSK